MVQKMNQERRDRKQKLRQQKKDKNIRKEKFNQEKERKLKNQEEIEKEEFEEKKKNIVDKIHSRKNKIKMSKVDMKKNTKKMVRKSPLHSKIQNSFEENHIIPELQKRKQTLSQIRNLHQPIRLSNIREHSDCKKKLLQEKMKEFFNNRADYATAAKDNRDRYNSYFWKSVDKREKAEKEEIKDKLYSIRDRHQKSLDYAKNAMEFYKPTISNKKRLEIEQIKKNLKDPCTILREKRGIHSVKMGQNQSMTSPLNKELSTEVSSPLRRSIRKLSKPKPVDTKRYSYYPVSNNKSPIIKHNYLRQMQLNRVSLFNVYLLN